MHVSCHLEFSPVATILAGSDLPQWFLLSCVIHLRIYSVDRGKSQPGHANPPTVQEHIIKNFCIGPDAATVVCLCRCDKIHYQKQLRREKSLS